jgi:hypothetical protein
MKSHRRKLHELIQKQLDGELTQQDHALLDHLLQEEPDFDLNAELEAYERIMSAYLQAIFPEPEPDFQNKILLRIQEGAEEERTMPEPRSSIIALFVAIMTMIVGMEIWLRPGIQTWATLDYSAMLETSIQWLFSVNVVLGEALSGVFTQTIGKLADNPLKAWVPSLESLGVALAGLVLFGAALNAYFIRTIKMDG